MMQKKTHTYFNTMYITFCLMNSFSNDGWKTLYIEQHNSCPTNVDGQSKLSWLDHSSSSDIVPQLQKHVRVMTRFDNFVCALLTTNNFKTSVRTYNLIRDLTTTLNPSFQMKIYRTIHDTIWPFMSNHCLPPSFLLSLQTKQTVSKVTHPQHIIRIILPYTWAKEDFQNPLYLRQLISKCSNTDVPDVYDSQSYSRRIELHNLHAFIPFLHDTDTYCARIFDIISFPTNTPQSYVPKGSVICKQHSVHPISIQHTYFHNKNYYGGQIALIWLVYPTMPNSRAPSKLDH